MYFNRNEVMDLMIAAYHKGYHYNRESANTLCLSI